MFFRTYSPQGDGNFGESNNSRNLSQGFSEPIPRKGTETVVLVHKTTRKLFSFFRTYSPQGDGNTSTLLLAVLLPLGVFQNLFPARGRKPQAPSEPIGDVALMFFRTYSPQGDGNNIDVDGIEDVIGFLLLSRSFRQKGTVMFCMITLIKEEK